jgi:hypothetical protein
MLKLQPMSLKYSFLLSGSSRLQFVTPMRNITPPLFGLPVEMWIDVFSNCFIPEVVFGYAINSFQIEAYHRALFDGACGEAIRSANKRRVYSMLVCRDWKYILDNYVKEEIPCITSDDNFDQFTQSKQYPLLWDDDYPADQSLISPNGNSRRFTLLNSNVTSHTAESLRSLPVQVLRIRSMANSLYFVRFKDVQDLVHYPADLRVLHVASGGHRIAAGFFRSVANVFTNIQVLSLSVFNVAAIGIGITFPHLSTLMLRDGSNDWRDRLPDSWHFPLLQHLSLESNPWNGMAPFFQDILERYSTQLLSVRCPTLRPIALRSSPNLSLPKLETWATDLLNFEPANSLFTTDLCPIRFLVHSWDIRSFIAPNQTLRTFLHDRSTPTAKRAEIAVYEQFVQAIPLLPRLEAICIPTDFYKVHSHRRNRRLDEAILKSFTLLKNLCDSRGIRILDLHGDLYGFSISEYHSLALDLIAV